MTVTQLAGALFYGVTAKECERRAVKKLDNNFAVKWTLKSSDISFSRLNHRRKTRFNNRVKCCGLNTDLQNSDSGLNLSSVQDSISSNGGISSSVGDCNSGRPAITDQLHLEHVQSEPSPEAIQKPPQSVQTELIMLSLPAIAGQAIEPLAQLMETAYVGRLGSLELASAGVSMSIFNVISKVFNIPLLSVATSFVAEDISRMASDSSVGDNGKLERKPLPSVSTALLLAVGIGLVEALAMYLGSGIFLNMMGIPSASPMRVPAEKFLRLRAIGAPAVVVSLAVQGIFRGFKDTKTPVLCLGLGNFSAVFLFPILMYGLRLGATGAAISTVVSQYIVTFLMMWHLSKRTVLLLPNIKDLHFAGYLKSGGFLLGRTLAAVMTITLSTSMAARQGALAVAAHQVCLQVWLSVSLLADAQAASGQALIASSAAKHDYKTVKDITFFALKAGLFTGISLALILGVSFGTLATLFTNDAEVLAIVRSGLLFVSASQPINALAYIFDGLHYGISDFSYAAWSMMLVGAISSAFMLYAPSVLGLSGVWSGLTLFMGLRTVAGYVRIINKNGPWWFLQENVDEKVRLVNISA